MAGCGIWFYKKATRLLEGWRAVAARHRAICCSSAYKAGARGLQLSPWATSRQAPAPATSAWVALKSVRTATTPTHSSRPADRWRSSWTRPSATHAWARSLARYLILHALARARREDFKVLRSADSLRAEASPIFPFWKSAP